MGRGVKGLARQRIGDRMIFVMDPLSSFEIMGKNSIGKVEEAPSGLLAGLGRRDRWDFFPQAALRKEAPYERYRMHGLFRILLQHHQLVSLRGPSSRMHLLPNHTCTARGGTHEHRGCAK